MKSLEKSALRIKNLSKKETDKFINRHILPNKDIVTIILKAHLYIEKLIEDILISSLAEPKIILKKNISFAKKVDLLEALGINNQIQSNITKELRTTNKIRNNFVHNIEYKITPNDINELLQGVSVPKSFNLRKKLISSLFRQIAYLQALRDICKERPFFFNCMRNKSLYVKDKTFNFKKIFDKDDLKNIVTFLEKLKY